jgi:hypothetical protein
MRVAGSIVLAEVLAALAARRPVFQSERDFQLALAWEVQTAVPKMHVYLESRPKEGVHLDLEFVSPDLKHSTAVELKYFTRRWSEFSTFGREGRLRQMVVDGEAGGTFSAARRGACRGPLAAHKKGY